MAVRTWLARLSGAVLAVALLGLVVGQLLGQPMVLSYVTSESMAPTIEEGDGFLVVPSALADDPEPGDVVVFEARTLHGGGLTTHRIVEETDRGFVTRGDGNPFTDQDGGEPPVKRSQVVADVVQLGGQPVVVPEVGTALSAIRGLLDAARRVLAVRFGLSGLIGTRGLAYGLLVIGGLSYAVSVLREDDTRKRRERSRTRDAGRSTGLVLAVLGVVLVGAVTAGMAVPSGPRTIDLISAENDAPGARLVPQGETETRSYDVHNSGMVPTVVFVSTRGEGIAADRSRLALGPNDRETVALSLTAPAEIGYYRYTVAEQHYLRLLPVAWIESLYRIHPLAPVVVIDLLVVALYALAAVALFGSVSKRMRRRERRLSLWQRLKRRRL